MPRWNIGEEKSPLNIWKVNSPKTNVQRFNYFLDNVYQKLLAVRIIFSTLGSATTGIVSLQIDIRIIVRLRITNMCKFCCMPTVFGINYDCALTAATKPMDQYFCWVLGVEWRISQVVGVIDQQPVRRGTAI